MGFARIRGGECGHDLLLAFSCSGTAVPTQERDGVDSMELMATAVLLRGDAAVKR